MVSRVKENGGREVLVTQLASQEGARDERSVGSAEPNQTHDCQGVDAVTQNVTVHVIFTGDGIGDDDHVAGADDNVVFDTQDGKKGLNAVNVRLA